MNNFTSIKVTLSVHATKRVENWPAKRRSARLHKKLTKLRGPQLWDAPAIIETPFGVIAHPAAWKALKDRSTLVQQ